MQSVSMNANEYWATMDSEKEFENNAKYGLAISVAFVFVMIVLLTKNIMIGILVSISVGIIMLNVMFIIMQ